MILLDREILTEEQKKYWDEEVVIYNFDGATLFAGTQEELRMYFQSHGGWAPALGRLR